MNNYSEEFLLENNIKNITPTFSFKELNEAISTRPIIHPAQCNGYGNIATLLAEDGILLGYPKCDTQLKDKVFLSIFWLQLEEISPKLGELVYNNQKNKSRWGHLKGFFNRLFKKK